MIREFESLDDNPIATVEFSDWWDSLVPTVDAIPHSLLPLSDVDWRVWR